LLEGLCCVFTPLRNVSYVLWFFYNRYKELRLKPFSMLCTSRILDLALVRQKLLTLSEYNVAGNKSILGSIILLHARAARFKGFCVLGTK
jgi:hypothetical protein